ncbi:unnamed protein product [Macrosiphum euphorbiae]|uniref:BESS domain-containing protein n=1 Tax=Macrosiphum euphorbiae TaxID=13131 RepID=A0AAV0YBQ3_9HEMI|nr:unnamed protein product [Macrosiphum euphorbiae]
MTLKNPYTMFRLVVLVQILPKLPANMQWGLQRKRKKTQVDTADDCIINYIQSKSNKPPNEDNAKKLFLLSLLPDLEEISTVQFRAFRRDVGNLIDRTLGQPPIPYLTSNNYQTTFQNIIPIPHHTMVTLTHQNRILLRLTTLTCCTKNFNHICSEDQKIE